MSICTVYATIGNSDDKLGQAQWATFANEFVTTIRVHSREVHGVWWSEPGSAWQNCCVGFAIAEESIAALQAALAKMREFFGQDAVTWVRGHPPEMI